MIEISIELQDWNGDYSESAISIPSDIRTVLDRQNEYVIVDSMPSIPGIQTMDVWKLNEVIDDINSENPDMTAELLVLLMETVDGSLHDDEFIRRIKDKDFMFEDISNITMGDEEVAARYIVEELGVPFDSKINKETLAFITRDEVSEYIKWDEIWWQYEAMGFKLAEDVYSDDPGVYLVHWR